MRVSTCCHYRASTLFRPFRLQRDRVGRDKEVPRTVLPSTHPSWQRRAGRHLPVHYAMPRAFTFGVRDGGVFGKKTGIGISRPPVPSLPSRLEFLSTLSIYLCLQCFLAARPSPSLTRKHAREYHELRLVFHVAPRVLEQLFGAKVGTVVLVLCPLVHLCCNPHVFSATREYYR